MIVNINELTKQYVAENGRDGWVSSINFEVLRDCGLVRMEFKGVVWEGQLEKLIESFIRSAYDEASEYWREC